MGSSLTTEVVIDAPREVVWDVLLDGASFSEWNPFMIESTLSPNVAVGDIVVNKMKLPGSSPMVFKPRILTVEKNSELVWLGSLGCRGIFDGDHHFELETVDGKTRLKQYENFSGCLIVSLYCCLGCVLLNNTRTGFEALNEALKERAESRVSTS